MPKRIKKSELVEDESDAPGSSRPGVSSGSLKLLLKVPKQGSPMVESRASSVRSGSPDQPDDAAEDDAADADVGSDVDDEAAAAPATKRRRRKKRFRLTPVTQRVRRPRAPKAEPADAPADEDGAADDEHSSAVAKDEVAPMPSRQRLADYSPLQLLLDNLLRTFQRKDPDEYFTSAVTDAIAPGYSAVIQKPMDFSKMRVKLDKEEFKSVKQFEEDIQLIISNALAYNEPATVYFHAAQKLQHVAEFVFNKERLAMTIRRLPFLAEISADQLGFDLPTEVPNSQKPARLPKSLKNKNMVPDEATVDQILLRANDASQLVAKKLAARKPKSELVFLKQKEDGATSLNFLTPETARPADGERRAMSLGDFIGRLRDGTPGLSALTEDRANLAVPISYLDYGPYATFAPQYDSTWATLSKRHSDLLLASYGDRAGADYAWSMRSFVADGSDSLLRSVDRLLDALTDGAHSAATATLNEDLAVRVAKPKTPPPATEVDFDALKSLANIGMDMSYLDEMERQTSVVDEPPTSTRLRRTAALLADLDAVEQRRLSAVPEFTLTHTAGPSHDETLLAQQVCRNLSALVDKTTPSQLASARQLHQLTGIVDPQQDIDMDVLREFFQVSDA